VRHSRNIAIEGFGGAGQRKLRNARVLVIGAGGLGSPVLFYLAAAGVGTLGIVDSDEVELSNLQRQILHRTADIGTPKTSSAAEKLRALDPEIVVETHPVRFTSLNAAKLIAGYDFVVDCCDNYATKFLINDVCVAASKPFSHGAILALRGEVMTWVPGRADYRSVFGGPPPEGTVATPAEAGTLGAVAGIVGSIQAAEVIKYLTGIGDLITDRLLIVDGRTMSFHSLKI
jgi:molybdopterin/thiamine biosynthesis adenylyltransferase